jgi:outer membrane protein OmpA-like peptidoglycan-associated protein
MCTDAHAVDTSVSRNRLTSFRPEYPDRRAVEALDSLGLTTRIEYQARGAVITLPTDSFFESGTAELTRNARWRLDEIASALAQQYGRDIEILGFTDGLGDPDESAALSLRRATAIRDYVVSKGANAQQIRVEGLGQKKPVADNATVSGRSSNRRIEIVVDTRRPEQI